MRYTSGQPVKYVGLTQEESKLADMANVRMNNINFLADVELEDLYHAKLQLIRDIIEDNWVCNDCEKQKEKKEEMKDDLYDVITEMRYCLNVMADYVDNTSKIAVEKWNETVKTLMKEVERLEKSVDKNLRERDEIGKFNLDFILDEVKHYPKEEE